MMMPVTKDGIVPRRSFNTDSSSSPTSSKIIASGQAFLTTRVQAEFVSMLMCMAGLIPRSSNALRAPPIPSKGDTKTSPSCGLAFSLVAAEGFSCSLATHSKVSEDSSGSWTWYRCSVCLSRQHAPQTSAALGQQPHRTRDGRASQTWQIQPECSTRTRGRTL